MKENGSGKAAVANRNRKENILPAVCAREPLHFLRMIQICTLIFLSVFLIICTCQRKTNSTWSQVLVCSGSLFAFKIASRF
ncbi:hypothetical protein LJC08_05105 [Methanimicrococcus sp. OttesenSCG-928-J09]|nr:hypothetical protein [Methanimicrococcus sp. OttesenSCG-928-J09]